MCTLGCFASMRCDKGKYALASAFVDSVGFKETDHLLFASKVFLYYFSVYPSMRRVPYIPLSDDPMECLYSEL